MTVMRPIPDADARRQSSAGFTLVELLVYVSLFVLILTIAGGMLLSGLRGERIVSGAGDAAESGQLVAQSVKRGISNASNFKHTVDAGGRELLVAHTRGSAAGALTWACEGWFYDPSLAGGSLFRKRLETVAPITAPAAPYTGWILLADGVRPAEAGAAALVLKASGPSVTLDMTVDGGSGGAPTLVSTTTHIRIPGAESTACF